MAPPPKSPPSGSGEDPVGKASADADWKALKAANSAKPARSSASPDMSLEKRAKRNAKARGKHAEQRVADLLGGRLTISSGRTSLEKGDVRVADLNLFVEVKYCGVRQGRGDTSVSFDREWLEKTILDADVVGMLPLVALRFRDGSGAYATTDTVFERLIEQLRLFQDDAAVLTDLFALFPDEMAALHERRAVLLNRAKESPRSNS